MISVEYFVTDVRAAQTTKIEHGAKLTCECGKDLKCGKWDDFRKREVEHFVESDKFLERRNDIHRGANSGSLAFDEAYKRVQRLIESDGLKERGNYVASGLKVDSIRCGECLGDLLLTANVRYEAPTSL